VGGKYSSLSFSFSHASILLIKINQLILLQSLWPQLINCVGEQRGGMRNAHPSKLAVSYFSGSSSASDVQLSM